MCDFTFVLVRSPSCFMSYLYFRFPTLQTKVLITICADVNYLYKNRSMTAQIQKSVCVPILPTRDHLLALWCFHSACLKLFVVVHNCNKRLIQSTGSCSSMSVGYSGMTRQLATARMLPENLASPSRKQLWACQ